MKTPALPFSLNPGQNIVDAPIDEDNKMFLCQRIRNGYPPESADWQYWNWWLLEFRGEAARCKHCDLHFLLYDLDSRGICGFCRAMADNPPTRIYLWRK